MNGIPIFLASNDKYAPFVATTIVSICYNTKSFINFYILDGGITNLRKKQIENIKNIFNNFSIEFIKIDFENLFKNFKEVNYWTLDIYSRFLIPILVPKINKAIYLDVDIIVLNDIKELYEQDLENYSLGAVPESTDEKILYKRKKLLNMKSNSEYFNSGVLLFDCKKWRASNIFEKILDEEKKLRKNLMCPDQDLLNKYFDNHYKQLDIKFNLLNGHIFFKNILPNKIKNNIETAISNTFVRHFEGPYKPWLFNINEYGDKIKYFNEFWFFAKMTEFYDGLLANFIVENSGLKNNEIIKKTIKLFNIFPIIKIKKKRNKIKIYLFNFIPLLTIKGN